MPGVARAASRPLIATVEAAAYTIPTDAPESDGTIAWTSTTIVVVHAGAGDRTGTGYSYADAAAAGIVQRVLAPALAGVGAMETARAYTAMTTACRNLGRPGVASCAISAVDVALWDLKARLLDAPLVDLLGTAREEIPVYGSGGFTSYSVERLRQQLGGWAADGFRAVKMKVGRDSSADRARVRQARAAIGDAAELFVDANGAYSRKQALMFAEAFAGEGVTWFEEPVSSDDLRGLRLIRDRAPAGMDVAAGEYGYDTRYFNRMLEAGAVDVLQADATRCGGVTGFLEAAAVADAWQLPLSAHTAPSLHTPLCCAARRARNLEYFHDHVRIEQMLFDHAPRPTAGALRPDRSVPGLGIVFKQADAARFTAS